MEKFFPVSVWYGAKRARAPMITPIEEKDIPKIEQDLKTIKDAGFNTVRFWYDWFTAEPLPDVWHFNELEILLNAADKLGLRAIIQVYTDSAPNWVEADHPDSLFVDRSGLKIHSQASPGYCADHPYVRNHIADFLKKTAEVAISHDCFLGWDIWSEPHIVQWSWMDYMKDPWFCFCENSIKRFREWLKNRYGDITKLNSAWYRTHRDWSEIIPPRYISLSTFTDILDWIKFNTEKIAEDLGWKYECIHSVDKDHIIASHAAISSVYGMPGISYGASDDWKLSEKVDVWGTSFYPKHTGPWMPLKPYQMGVALDATYSSCKSKGKPFWVGELQTGDGVTGLRFGSPVTADDVDRWAWYALSRGATGLNYYAWYPMSCGYEVSGFGLSEPDGAVNDRVVSAGNVAKAIEKNYDKFMSAKPLKAEVGIIYNVQSHGALAGLRETSADIIRKDMFGFYKIMQHNDIPVNFLHLDDMSSVILSGYKVIFAPLCIVLNDEVAAVLKTFVENGGTLIADGRIGWMDENGNLSLKIPSGDLDKVFGCLEDYMLELRESLNIKMKSGGTFENSKFINTFIPTSGEAIGFHNDKAVIVKNSCGKGTGYMSGVLLGNTYLENDEEIVEKFVMDIINSSEVSRKFDVKTDTDCRENVEVRLNESENGYICFIFNHGGSDENIGIHISDPAITCECTAKSMKTNEEIVFSKMETGIEFDRKISGYKTEVIFIEK